MQQLTAASFGLASCQATVFTPDGGFSASKIMKEFYPRHESRFNANPTVLPVPEDAPLEIPRIILEGTSHEWRCQLSPSRADVIWRRTQSTAIQVSLSEFFLEAEKILLQYTGLLNTRIGRVSGLTTRFSEHETPGLFLARHFCKERWDTAPFNRPENFELHAHKKFLMAGEFQVNSWVRSKTGLLTDQAAQKPIVLVEQDMNTLAEAVADKNFQEQEVSRFLAAAAAEVDVILRLYYPNG